MKVILVIFLLLSHSVFSFQNNGDPARMVEAQSEKFGKAIALESIEPLTELFTVDATILPEYHQMLLGTPVLIRYFSDFFEKTETLFYQKHAFEIQDFGDGLLELGTFKHRYKTPKGASFDYNGKYMTFWELQNGVPKIKAHIWGASSYFEAENLAFVSVDAPEITIDIPQSVWKDAIEEIRTYVYSAVLEGDAKTTLRSYAEDAIYMTYYDPPFLGKTQIANYFYPHYQPGSVKRDSLMTRAVKILDLGQYALKFGEYHVEWTHENRPYFIKGKGLTLYRRKEDGNVEIYRQMINHSMPPTVKIFSE
ncbi:MAG: nuclear transport factor 2 family protein [Bacteroidota bacterium]